MSEPSLIAAERREDLTRTSRLLYEVFKIECFNSYQYLKWLYEDSPEGKEISANLDDGKRRLGHYCVIPQTYHTPWGLKSLCLSLNTAVASAARGRHVFVNLAKTTYKKAYHHSQIEGVIGVANAYSTPGFVQHLGFNLLMPLPVVIGILPPIQGNVNCFKVTGDFLKSKTFKTIVKQLNDAPTEGWAQQWVPDKLAWRLARPGARYALHLNDNALVISTFDTFKGIPIAIILKFFLLSNQKNIRLFSILTAICKYYGTFFYLYAGFNAHAKTIGLSLPRRIAPSPLNLIYRPICPDRYKNQNRIDLTKFEFFDFDAY